MRYQDATGAGSRRAEEATPLIVRRRGRLSNLRLRDDDDEKDDDDKTKSSSPTTASPTTASPKTASPTSTKSPSSSPTTTSSSSITSSSTLTSTTLLSTTPPPPASTLPPPIPLPPPQTFGKSPPEQTTLAPAAPAAPAATSIPQAAPAVTPTPQAITQAPTTLSSLTLPSSSASVPVAAISPDQAQTQNVASQSQVGSSDNSAAIAAAILAILGVAAFLVFFGWKYVNRRRKRQQENAAPTKTEIYNYYASESDEKSSQISSNQSSSNSMPSWLKRQLSKLTHDEQPQEVPQRPKEAKVNGWMDRHTSKMLDPMDARASMVSSVASDLGPPPSISPASVVGGNRQSVLSEMGQIRRDAVPPPLDVGMVERAKRMHEEQSEREREREIARAAALLEAPASVAGQRRYP